MPFIDHIKEFRRRLIVSLCALLVATIVSFIFYDAIIYILFHPFKDLDIIFGNEVLFVNTLFEGFITKIKISLLAGIVISIPLHFYNLIKFVFPGLTSKEKKVIKISLGFSFLLIGISSYYSYVKVIPVSISFLTNAGFIPQKVGLLLNFGKNIFYILHFLLATIILFQSPIVLEVLLVMKVVKRHTLVKISRFAIVIIFTAAAILTPPDFVSQLGLALPMVLLYFLTILVAKIFKLGEA
jgi:sec-independent protein translocase protein TatC